MSAETRILPRRVAYATGLAPTKIVGPPNGSSGKNAPSHVSAAPGVSAKTHAHVVSSRDPAAAQRLAQQGSGQAIQRRPQDAKVEILGPRGQAPAPTVQASGVQTSVANPFVHQQMLLIASLLERYAEGTQAVGDQASTKLANETLEVLRQLHQRTVARAPAPAPQTSPFSVTTTILPQPAGPTAQARAAAAQEPVEISAEDSTPSDDPGAA